MFTNYIPTKLYFGAGELEIYCMGGFARGRSFDLLGQFG